MRDYIKSSSEEEVIKYCIYFDDPDDVADFADSLPDAIAKLKMMIDEAIEDGSIEDISLEDCQVTSVLAIDGPGFTDFYWDDEEVEYCADADDDYAQYL